MAANLAYMDVDDAARTALAVADAWVSGDALVLGMKKAEMHLAAATSRHLSMREGSRRQAGYVNFTAGEGMGRTAVDELVDDVVFHGDAFVTLEDATMRICTFCGMLGALSDDANSMLDLNFDDMTEMMRLVANGSLARQATIGAGGRESRDFGDERDAGTYDDYEYA